MDEDNRVGDAFEPKNFIDEQIEVIFNHPPYRSKTPHAPDGFRWREEVIRIQEVISEWVDYSRKGSRNHNMQPHNMAKAVRRGSWGVGRFYFRVKSEDNQFFDLYYDRSPKNVDNRLGGWFLWRALKQVNRK
ncbi:MAG TPA: hypothetical protein G4N95_07010 [Anaerolineae bacterium]|nr:hypothetical protein [Anaerolineae bacterium]